MQQRRQLRQAIKMAPDNASFHYDLALALKLKDDLPAAMAEMHKAIDTRSETGRCVLHVGCHAVAAG